MLRNIDPILSPDLLQALRAMGHGDEIVIADANFPGESIGPRCLRADGSSTTEMLRAVLSVLPLDTFVPDPVHAMEVVGDPAAIPEVVAACQRIVDDIADNPAPIALLERFAFYDRARSAFVIVQTGERRLYGCLFLKKGVLLA